MARWERTCLCLAALGLAACTDGLPAPPGLTTPSLPRLDIDTALADTEPADTGVDLAEVDLADTDVADTDVADTDVEPADTPLPPDWWDPAWRQRSVLSVTTGAEPVAAAYTVALRFDHAAHVAAATSLASGDDLRIVFVPDDGSPPRELARVLEPESRWDDPATTLHFALQAPIDADTTDTRYALYTANPLAGAPPTTWTEVFLAGDAFDDGTLDPGLVPSSRNATLTERDGALHLDLADGDLTAAATVALARPLPDDRRFLLRHRGRVDALGSDLTAETKLLGIVESPSVPTFLDDNNLENERRRIFIFHRADEAFGIFHHRGGTGIVGWSIDNGWADGTRFTRPLGQDALYDLVSDGTSFLLRIHEPGAGGALLLETLPVPWSELSSTRGDPLWFYFGEVYGAHYWADQTSDYLYLRQLVTPEPVVALGASQSLP